MGQSAVWVLLDSCDELIAVIKQMELDHEGLIFT